MTKKQKTNTERIKRIYDLAESHWGNVKFVGLKFDKYDGWIAKVSFEKVPGAMVNLKAHSEHPDEALKKLKKQVKLSIHRYQTV